MLYMADVDAVTPLTAPYIASCRKHSGAMVQDGLQRTSARLFSNPAGDYGSMVNERVRASTWEDGAELGDTWASRNAFSYGRCVCAGLDLLSLLLSQACAQRETSTPYDMPAHVACAHD